jgi:uncharacterized glyoxalase superfamily protein PhnB
MTDTNSNEEFYPMPAFPILEVEDLARSMRWYQDVLNFRNVFTMPGAGGQPILVHFRWAKYADLLLRSGTGEASDGAKGRGVILSFRVTTGTVDDVAKRARDHGAEIVAAPEDKPWNTREFTVADPDGFRLTFTHGPLKERSIDDIVESAQQGQAKDR